LLQKARLDFSTEAVDKFVDEMGTSVAGAHPDWSGFGMLKKWTHGYIIVKSMSYIKTSWYGRLMAMCA